MQDFIEVEDYELWVKITKGKLTTITDSEGKKVPKPTKNTKKVTTKWYERMQKLSIFSYFDKELITLTASQVVPLQKNNGISYKILRKVKLKFVN